MPRDFFYSCVNFDPASPYLLFGGVAACQRLTTRCIRTQQGSTSLSPHRRGLIAFATPDARRWLREYFARPPHCRTLPRKLSAWLVPEGRAPTKDSLVVRRERGHLFVRRLRPHPKDCIVLLLEVVSEGAAASVARRHSGLTRREAEVLKWIAAGKSNREMAQILDLSPSTIGKHLERIFRKLGVENRTAAASFHSEGTSHTAARRA